jgi:hypothetical protein
MTGFLVGAADGIIEAGLNSHIIGRESMKGGLCVLTIGFGLVPLLAGCCAIPLPGLSITGSGDVVTLEEDITEFDEVDVSHAFEVDITQGEDFLVVVRVDDNLREYLRVVKRGSTLVIGLEPGRPLNVRRATLEAEVTMPELTGIELSGASHVTITGFESPKPLEVDASGASELRGDIEAGDARFHVSGASRVTLRGSADDLTIDGSGASRVDLSDFDVLDADIELSGASRATVRASGRLDVRASGASHVSYAGSPTLGDIDTSGASTVRPE